MDFCNKTPAPLKAAYVLVVTLLLLLWIMQASVNAYWIQTYHRPSPLEALDKFSWWRSGKSVYACFQSPAEDTLPKPAETEALARHAPPAARADDLPRLQPLIDIDKTLSYRNQTSADRTDNNQFKLKFKLEVEVGLDASHLSTHVAQTPEKAPQPAESNKPVNRIDSKLTESKSVENKLTESKLADNKPAESKAAENKPAENNLATVKSATVQTATVESTAVRRKNITLYKGDKVFFVGDSMMQGIAPHVKYALSRQGVKGINLSKQSTGLSYTSFFDWQKTVKDTFAKHNDIHLMIVFLGPNDPWDIPNPEGGKYLKFKSPRWEKIYRKRIQTILQTAQFYGAQVLWLGIPNMRKTALNEGVNYLNTLYQSEAQNAGIHYLSTNAIFAYKGKTYNKYATDAKGKKIAIRSKDGTHFTPKGQRRIAGKILSLITIK